MRLTIGRGTLTKEEQYKLGELLLRAGYAVSIRKGKTKETRSTTVIDLGEPEPDAAEEDLS